MMTDSLGKSPSPVTVNRGTHCIVSLLVHSGHQYRKISFEPAKRSPGPRPAGLGPRPKRRARGRRLESASAGIKPWPPKAIGSRKLCDALSAVALLLNDGLPAQTALVARFPHSAEFDRRSFCAKDAVGLAFANHFPASEI